MKEIIECNKKIRLFFPVNIKGEHVTVELPKHKPVEQSWERLKMFMELHFQLLEEDKLRLEQQLENDKK